MWSCPADSQTSWNLPFSQNWQFYYSPCLSQDFKLYKLRVAAKAAFNLYTLRLFMSSKSSQRISSSCLTNHLCQEIVIEFSALNPCLKCWYVWNLVFHRTRSCTFTVLTAETSLHLQKLNILITCHRQSQGEGSFSTAVVLRNTVALMQRDSNISQWKMW